MSALATQETAEFGSATFSPNRLYRYYLSRRLANGGWTACFVMLNPSKADAINGDTTISKCMGFARKLGAGELAVVNLFGYRATDPKKLLEVEDPEGPENRATVITVVREAKKVILAWGNLSNELWKKSVTVRAAIKNLGRDTLCLGTTKANHPRHPVRLPYNTPLSPYWKASQ